MHTNTYKFTFQGKKTTNPVIQQCHKHIHTYGRLARNGGLSPMLFSWTAAASVSIIGSAYGASGCHQRFRSAVGSSVTTEMNALPGQPLTDREVETLGLENKTTGPTISP
ncbi:hypothetical protein PBY51_015608 [Eleginops maclovinus]|uniref:Uncharacterized protein n=1 Tax=Eleginops maclovinus TaxID=56733 RepID=A0AAN8AQ15_ELEMC|nr:hypothetical protein PBY51_015608 [Eleginops maclovinus]